MRKLPDEIQTQLSLCKSSKSLRQIKKTPEPTSSNEIWLTTLSDLLMLLMIFFVFLLAVPYAHNNPAQASGDVVPAEPSKPAAVAEEKKIAAESDPNAVDELDRELQVVLAKDDEGKGITVERRPHAVIITLPEQILFDSGQAQLKAVARPALSAVAAFVTSHPELSLEVQGHTDDRPIKNNRYPSNWELSADRATQVAKVLVELGADPVKIATKGLGEYHPVASNDSDEGRLKNRRVEILLSL